MWALIIFLHHIMSSGIHRVVKKKSCDAAEFTLTQFLFWACKEDLVFKKQTNKLKNAIKI